MAIKPLRLKYNPPSHRAHIGHARGKGKRTPPDGAFEAPGRKLPQRLRSSLRRVSQAGPRCGKVIDKTKTRKPPSFGAALGGNGEVERSAIVSRRLADRMKLPCQCVPIEPVEPVLAQAVTLPVRKPRLYPRWGNFR
jgi:hypothetical protein